MFGHDAESSCDEASIPGKSINNRRDTEVSFHVDTNHCPNGSLLKGIRTTKSCETERRWTQELTHGRTNFGRNVRDDTDLLFLSGFPVWAKL